MTGDARETQRRLLQNRKVGRELAERLADEADEIAVTFDRLAEVHESLVLEGHPLAGSAAERAAAERMLARKEREAAVWFRSLESSTDEGAG